MFCTTQRLHDSILCKLIMNDDLGWVPAAFCVSIAALGLMYFIGWTKGNQSGLTSGRNQGIIYCMEKSDKCKIEYQYLKLENSK